MRVLTSEIRVPISLSTKSVLAQEIPVSLNGLVRSASEVFEADTLAELPSTRVAPKAATASKEKLSGCLTDKFPNCVRRTAIGGVRSVRAAVDALKMAGGLCQWALIFIPLPKALKGLSNRIEKNSAHCFLTGPKEKPDIRFIKDQTLQGLIQDQYISLLRVLEENRESLGNTPLQLDTVLDDINIHAWHIPASSGRPTVVLHHGRGTNMMHMETVMRLFRDQNLGLLLYDYPGFGRSGGVAIPEALYKSGLAVSLYAKDTLGINLHDQIHLGNSLGSMVAANTAHALEAMGELPPRALVLVNPLPSFREVFTHIRDRYKLRWLFNDQRIRLDLDGATPLKHLTRTPVHMVRGRHDHYIPQHQVERMFEGLGSLASPQSQLFYQQSSHQLPHKSLTFFEDARHRLKERDYQRLAQHVDVLAQSQPVGPEHC